MKKLFNLFLLLTLLVIESETSYGQQDTTFIRPKYQLIAKRVTFTSNSLVFDIFLKHRNPDSTVFEYAGGQYDFRVSPTLRNGGLFNYAFATNTNGDTISDLPILMRPRSPSISPDSLLLRLGINTFPGAGNGYIISATANNGLGTRIIRMKLTNTVAFNGSPWDNIRWHNGLPNPYTKIFAYTGVNGIVNTEITDSTWHIMEIPPTSISSNQTPIEFSLSQNYPNPFNPSTKIEYALPVDAKVTLLIYDITGREIQKLVNENQTAGQHSVLFRGDNFASGVYFYKIRAEGVEDRSFEMTKRMFLIK